MRVSEKAWQVQKSMEKMNGTEFQDKIDMINDHYYIHQEPVLLGEGQVLAKNMGR